MKKIFLLLLSLIFIISCFSACDEAEESKADISKAESAVSQAVSETESEISEDVSAEESEVPEENSAPEVSQAVSETFPESSEDTSKDIGEESTNETLSFTITDTRDPDADVGDMVETFYSDEEYVYEFPGCPTYKFIVVEYSDGTTQNIKEALEAGNVTIEDLEKANVFYYKRSKATGEYERVNAE